MMHYLLLFFCLLPFSLANAGAIAFPSDDDVPINAISAIDDMGSKTQGEDNSVDFLLPPDNSLPPNLHDITCSKASAAVADPAAQNQVQSEDGAVSTDSVELSTIDKSPPLLESVNDLLQQVAPAAGELAQVKSNGEHDLPEVALDLILGCKN